MVDARQSGANQREARSRWSACTLTGASGILLAASLLGGVTGAQTGAGAKGSSQESAERIEAARAALDRYVETRRVLSLERRDWALGREMLVERIALLEREVAKLRGSLEESRKSLTGADEKRAELERERQRLADSSAMLAGTVRDLEGRTRELLSRVPDPIRERVRMLSQSLPMDPNGTEITLGARFQNVVGILNEVDKFNREVSIASEVRELPDGTSAQVTTLYFGLGQGFYASADGKLAGRGAASGAGWVWHPADEAAPRIARVIAIWKKEQPADFVQLPVRIE
jgi:hypothetical protein